MGLALITGPAFDSVSLAEAKGHCRVTSNENDGLLVGYILAARQYIEAITGRALVTQTWDYTLDHDWPWTLDFDTNRHVRLIEVPKPPLQSVTSISYVDSAGISQTLAADQYVVDAGTYVGRVWPAYSVIWPCVRCQPKAITVRFVAGYASGAPFPEPLRAAILLHVEILYDRDPSARESLERARDALLAPYRVFI